MRTEYCNEYRIVLVCAGSDLNVCSPYLASKQQCCSQSHEDELGMTLNNAIRYYNSHILGNELQALQTNGRALYTGLSSKYDITCYY